MTLSVLWTLLLNVSWRQLPMSPPRVLAQLLDGNHRGKKGRQ